MASAPNCPELQYGPLALLLLLLLLLLLCGGRTLTGAALPHSLDESLTEAREVQISTLQVRMHVLVDFWGTIQQRRWGLVPTHHCGWALQQAV